MQKFGFLLLTIFLLPMVMLMGQDTSRINFNKDIADLSLEELMNIKVSVASVKELTVRESPGVITVITEEEIASSGARDLMDILKNIPGFDFGMDVQGVVGLGIRGNWAHEGKILLQIDGQEMNEGLYGTLQFGNHYPVEQIKRIEIIRGPGSAIYGRYAEYAVVNIISKSAKDLNGFSLTESYGLMERTFARRNMSLYLGKSVNDFSLNVFAFYGEANRSNKIYHDAYGESFDMSNESGLTNSFVNLGMNYKKLSIRSIIDRYEVTTRDNYSDISLEPFKTYFNSFYTEIKNEFELSDKFSLIPKINFKSQVPYQFTGPVIEDDFKTFDIRNNTFRFELASDYSPDQSLNIITGVEYSYTNALQQSAGIYFENGKSEFTNASCDLFSQCLFKNKIVNVTAGIRYTRCNSINYALVPRIGITKVINLTHFKLLYGRSYRDPSILNIDANKNIHPENTSELEAEAGYQITDDMMVSCNGYEIETRDPIIFYYDPLINEDEYSNFSTTGTRGYEASLKIKKHWGSINVSYSFYSVLNKERMFFFMVPYSNKSLLAFANNKTCVSGTLRLTDQLFLSPSLIYWGTRWGIASVDVYGNPVYKKLDNLVVANLFFQFKNVFVNGLHFSLGVYNLNNGDYNYIQPYSGLHAPLPGESRELTFKISYTAPF